MTDTCGGAGSDAVAPSGPRGTEEGAPGVRDAQSVSVLTVAEVARRLGVSIATVYKVCAAGRLGHVRRLVEPRRTAVLREGLRMLAQAIMEAEVTELTGLPPR